MQKVIRTVETYKLTTEEIQALRTINNISCGGVRCNDCPLAVVGHKCIRDTSGLILEGVDTYENDEGLSDD